MIFMVKIQKEIREVTLEDEVVDLVGRTRCISHGNFRGNRSRTYYHDSSKNYSYVPKDSHSYHENTKNAQHALYDNGKFQNHIVLPMIMSEMTLFPKNLALTMVMLKVIRIHQE